MNAVGNMNLIHQMSPQNSFDTTLQNTQMNIPVLPYQYVQGYLFFNYYVSGGGGLVGVITPDIVVGNYRIASHHVNSSYGPISPFTQLSVTALMSWWVHFWMYNDIPTPNMLRVQFSQQVTDAANATVLLHGSELWYSLHH